MKYPYIVSKNGVWYPAGAEVPEDTKVELTNDVPDGALETNADGSVNTYDEEGNVTGTLSAEEIEELQEEAGAAFEAQEKPKRGRKPKEA